jgi:serine/threonine-protein kinase HipA
LLAGEEGVHMSLAGAQAKLAVAVFDGKVHLPLNGAASTHILKPAHRRFHDTVENELLCLRLAREVGIEAAAAQMRIVGGCKFLLVERYDRQSGANRRVRRLHQEDFCQALGIYPTAKYETGGGPSLADLFGVLDRHSRAPAADRLALLDQAIFACCIGDTDRHGKNFSLLLGAQGPRLAPAYDFMTALTYDGVTRNMAMKIDDQRRAEHVERRHWQRFARAVGLAPAATARRVDELAGVVADTVASQAHRLVEEFPADKSALELFAREIAKRAARIARNSRKDTAGAAAGN